MSKEKHQEKVEIAVEHIREIMEKNITGPVYRTQISRNEKAYLAAQVAEIYEEVKLQLPEDLVSQMNNEQVAMRGYRRKVRKSEMNLSQRDIDSYDSSDPNPNMAQLISYLRAIGFDRGVDVRDMGIQQEPPTVATKGLGLMTAFHYSQPDRSEIGFISVYRNDDNVIHRIHPNGNVFMDSNLRYDSNPHMEDSMPNVVYENGQINPEGWRQRLQAVIMITNDNTFAPPAIWNRLTGSGD